MRIPNETYETTLTPAAVDDISDRVRAFMQSARLPKRDARRFALTAEEILLESMEKGGEGAELVLVTGSRLGRPFFTIGIKGDGKNLFAARKGEQTSFTNGIMDSIGFYPEYAYSYGQNTYTFSVRRRKLNPLIALLTALILALLVGTAGRLLPNELRLGLLNTVLLPIHNTFLDLLGCIAGPLVFLSVAWGIYGVGAAATLKSVGKRLISGYIGAAVIAVLLATAACTPLFALSYSSGSGGVSGLARIFSALLGVIPRNIFSPFTEGNTQQIIFLGIVCGIAMLFLGQKTKAIAGAVEQINHLVRFFAELISALVPFLIFVVLLEMIWADSLLIFAKVYKLFLVFIALVLLFCAGLVACTAFRTHTKPWSLVRKGMPTLFAALTTASSAAAIESNLNAARDEYGIDETVASFGVPLGMVVFKVSTALNYLVMAFFCAEMYGVEISGAWILIMMFSSVILAVATPPIPGGALVSYILLFGQLGIPQDALVIALACDVIFDFIATGFDQFMMPFVLLTKARRVGLVDEKILRREPEKRKTTK